VKRESKKLLRKEHVDYSSLQLHGLHGISFSSQSMAWENSS
jgi:hypothetical protein